MPLRLIKLTLSNIKSSVSSGQYISELFNTKRGFSKADSLTSDFFNLLLERIIKAVELNTQGTVINKIVQLLAAPVVLLSKRSKWRW